MILSKEVDVILNSANMNHFKKLGYNDLKNGNKIVVPVEHLTDGSHSIIKVKCDICGEEKDLLYRYYVKNIKRYNFYSCQKCCSKKLKISYSSKTNIEIENMLDKKKKTMIERYGKDNPSQIQEFKNKRKETMNFLYGDECFYKTKKFRESSIETCQKKYGANYFRESDDFRKKSLEKFDILNINKNMVTMACDNNDPHNFLIDIDVLRKRFLYKTILCTICNPINSYTSSGYETQLKNFIMENYDLDTVSNNRKIIHPKEIDIYLPDLKLAFEFNGLYWHSEINFSLNYHLEKTELAEKQGIRLIHIYEDDWIYKQEIVKSRILNLLNKTPNKIYARKCEIKEVSDNKLVRDFLENNHIQGFVGSRIKIGLFYSGELVSLMTFGSLRRSMGQKSEDGTYEMLRFCNKLNTNVIGGASRLFKFFVKNFEPKEVTSYADRSWSQGNLYKNLGFELIRKTEPNYYYVIDGMRKHRFGFRKDELIKQGFDPLKTEHEIMLERKIYRIYDSGNLKYVQDFGAAT